MSDMIAYCGLNCAECNAFEATKANDSEQKKQLAIKWTEGLEIEFKPEDIDCNGCRSESISGWCRKVCKIRPCAEDREIKSCALCDDYPCDKLNEFLSKEPMARRNLDEIWKTPHV
jgi:hypothetical protein